MSTSGNPLREFDEHWNRSVLVVDDQPEIHQDFREILQLPNMPLASDEIAAGFLEPRDRFPLPEFELLHARSGEEACAVTESERARDRRVAIAYVDIQMPPGIDGVETVRRLRALDRDTEIILMTAYTDKSLSEIIGDSELLHKLLYLRKPFAREEVQQITLSLAVKWNVEQELAADRRRLADSHRRLEAVLEATGDAMAMYDGDGRLAFANGGYRQLLDMPAGSLREMSKDAALARFTEQASHLRLPAADRQGLFDGSGCMVTPKTDARAGPTPHEPLFYRSTGPVHDEGGGHIGDLVTYRDVSREIRIEQMTLEVERLRSEVETTYSFGGIIGSSAAIRGVCTLLERIVDADIDVLVRGESGTGKELVAKALHFNGPRKKRRFLAVNCAALPEHLIESELFGHERGSFTGAIARRIGCFEQADGGTLLLDEIGDMPLDLQAKLLRVLQEREFRRVGGRTAIPVDVRIIAATNRDLEAAMRAGTFREDLFYRLAVFPIELPPLRTRPEDIPLLAEHFLRKHAARSARPVQSLSVAASVLLARYSWPGNVRELENVIRRALLLETTDVLQAANLPPSLLPARAAETGTRGPAPVTTLADVERRAIDDALEQTGHNLTRAAEALGISRVTLHRKLKSRQR